MTTGIIMTEDTGVDSAALYRLLAWLSPSFPVGAYSYSHGLEWAIEDGTVKDASDLQRWLSDILSHGSGRGDAILLARVHDAFNTGDTALCREIAELSVAMQPSKERHLEATAQGTAFVTAVRQAWPVTNEAATKRLAEFDTSGGSAHIAIWTYPVAVGIFSAAHGLAVGPTAHGYLHAFAANLASAAVRAVPLGQTDGQRVIATLEPVVDEIAAEALTASLDDIGSASFRADIASQKHETQYTRLFRS